MQECKLPNDTENVVCVVGCAVPEI